MGAKSGGDIVGYEYYLGLHLALCYGPINSINRFLVNDKEAWSGTATGPTNTTITVNAKDLFGGAEREGGVAGDVDIDFGDRTQLENTYLQSVIDPVIPAFRGITCAIFNSFYIGNNPYIKPFALECTRNTLDTFGNTIWYSAKANINSGDMNPVHIIYECLTNDVWGLGYVGSDIDDASFTAAADTIFDEGLGLSLLWTKQEQIGKFIQTVLNHMHGVVTSDLSTGLFKIKLFRDDYDPNTLPVYNEDNISKLKFSRRAWGETIN